MCIVWMEVVIFKQLLKAQTLTKSFKLHVLLQLAHKIQISLILALQKWSYKRPLTDGHRILAPKHYNAIVTEWEISAKLGLFSNQCIL